MRPIWTAAVLATSLTFAAAPARADETDAEAFAALSKLQGRWQGEFSNGNKHTVDYRLSAGGSVLVETWSLGPTRESITIYHMDGDRLLATHYCPQGNQPRLERVDDGDPKRMSFAFVDGGNLQVADGWHQDSFWIEIDGDALYRRDEVYAPNVASADAGQDDDAPPVTYRRLSAPTAD
jgi:hypothetical protein